MFDRSGVDTGGFGGGGARRGPWKGCAIAAGIGCILTIALIATCVGGGAWFFHKSSSTATDDLRRLLDLVREDRFDDAYRGVSATWRDSTTPEEFRVQAEGLRPLATDDLELSIRGMRIESGDERYREVTYLATFGGERAVVRIRLQRDPDGVERISGVQVDRRASPGEADGSEDLEEPEHPDGPAERP